MTNVIAIRPEPGLSATIAAGAELGLEVSGFPLFEVEAAQWDLPNNAGVDGLLIGSANALRNGGNQLAKLRHLPVYAVGATTAEQAHEQGFEVRHIGEGGLQQLLDGLDPTSRHLLRLAGEAHVPLDPPPQIRLTTRTVYRVVDKPLPSAMERVLRARSVVMLHSAGAARHFSLECERLDLPRRSLSLAALGPRILAAAGSGWSEARAASNPTESALLAMVQDMCH